MRGQKIWDALGPARKIGSCSNQHQKVFDNHVDPTRILKCSFAYEMICQKYSKVDVMFSFNRRRTFKQNVFRK